MGLVCHVPPGARKNIVLFFVEDQIMTDVGCHVRASSEAAKVGRASDGENGTLGCNVAPISFNKA